MLRSLFGFDWRKSNPHLLLLSKFLHRQTADYFEESENWKTVLGESPKQAIKRFIDEGMLAHANLNAQLDYKQYFCGFNISGSKRPISNQNWLFWCKNYPCM